MFGTQHTFRRLSGGIAIAAFVVAVAVPSAFARTFITDTLGGTGSPKAQPDVFERYVAIHQAEAAQSQRSRLITDTLGGNGYPKTDMFERSVAIQDARKALTQAAAVASRVDSVPYVNGGMSAATALSSDRTTGQPASAPSSGFDAKWGIGAGLAAGLLVLLLVLGGTRRHTDRQRPVTA